MATVSMALTAFVAIEHFAFMILEMLFWTTPFGRKTFGTSVEQAQMSKALAANQGLYNGFLVAGLVWALISGRRDVVVFFLSCVVVAGVFGAATVKPRILLVQAVPAIAALALLYLGW